MTLRKIAIAATLALAVVVAALGSASATSAAGKPALPAGTWTGTGVISGSLTDAAGTTSFSGKVGFRLVVSKKRWVKGTGSWVRTMKGSAEFSRSTMTGIAHLRLAGPSNEIDILYAEEVEGTVEVPYAKPQPVQFKRGWDDKPLVSQLLITRVTKCSAAGTIPTGEGMKITWTAKPLGCKG
jgi:hypothetical protein